MKKIRLIRLFIATSLLVLSSCEDNFDPKIFGTLNPDNFPSTETEYKDYALACYIPFFKEFVAMSCFQFLIHF